MAKKKKASPRAKKSTVRVNKKTLRDLGPKESTTGDVLGGRYRSPVD